MTDIDRFAKENVMKFLIGNKCDLDKKRVITFEEGRDLALQYDLPFMETSAKVSINIDELFVAATKNFLEKNAININKRVQKRTQSNIILIDKKKDQSTDDKKDSNCC